MVTKIKPPIEITPKQAQFHEAVDHYDEVGFGGARGPGKSFALGHEALRQSVSYPGNIGAMVRKDLVDLKDTTLEVFLKYVLPPYVAQGLRIEQRGGMRPETWIHAGGTVSKILWRDAKDVASLMSANLGWLGIDEAVEVSEDFYLMTSAALGRCRVADGTLAPSKIFWASNPGPGWAKKFFPVGHQSRRRVAEIEAEDGSRREISRVFIPAMARDNPHLDPFFEARLREKYPPSWVARFLEGDWSAFEGQVFVEFDRARHVLKRRVDLSKTGWTHILSVDWGFRSPAAALVVSIDPQGLFWVWREYRAAGRTPRQHKPYLDELVVDLGASVVQLMDPAAVDQSTGVTLREQFNEMDFSFLGWRKRKHGPDGSIVFLQGLLEQDRVRIAPDCLGLIEEIENAMWEPQTAAMADKADPKEQMRDKDDHSLDAFFGALEWWRMTPAPAEKPLQVDQPLVFKPDGSLVGGRRRESIFEV
ncbi:MAG: hypothetical protein ABIH23_16765 [bacterium]